MNGMVDLESVFIALVCATIYVNSIFCGFVFDDASAVKENKDLRPSTPLGELFRNDFWGTPMHQERSHKSYRPLTVLTFRWNYLVHGLHPAGYHAVNVILHLLVCILFLRVCRILSSECCAFISSLHFAVHPIHTEAVTGVVGRAELLSGLIFLLIFIQNEKSRHERCLHQSISVFIICVLLTIGTLCKEQCITIVAVLWAYEFILIYKSLLQLRIDDDTSATAPMSCLRRLFCRSPMHLLEMFRKYFFKNQRFLHLFVISLWAAVLMFVRMRIMDFQLPHFSEFDNPAAHAPTLIRRLTYLYLIPVNLWLLFCPSGLCVDWTLSSLPLITGWMDPRNCLTLVAFLGLALLFVMALNPNNTREQSVILAVGLSIMVFAFIPASNLFFPVGFVIAERVLYVPSFGFSLLFGFGYHVCVKRSLLNDRRPYSSQLQPVGVVKRKPIRHFVYKAILVLVLLSLSAKTVRRNFDWIDEYRLFSSALKVNPRNAKMWNNVGHALESEQKFHHALEYFRKAVDVQPNDIGAHINVGRTYVTLGKFDEAENAYRRALDFFPKPKRGQTYFARVAPKDLMVFINLANLLLNKDPPRLDEAAVLLRRAISLRSDFVEAYQNYGSVLIKQHNTEEAEAVYRKALEFQPGNPDLHYNLGVVLLESNRSEEGVSFLLSALSMKPGFKPAMLALASTLAESSNPSDRSRSKQLLEDLSSEEYELRKVWFSLAMLETDLRNYSNAVLYYRKLLQMEPEHRSALFNLALLYVYHLNLYEEAEPLLQQLIKVHPNHVKSYLLLGEIELNWKKQPRSALLAFEKAFELDPRNIQAKHNVCVTLAEAGDLKASETCILEAISMAPRDETLRNYLSIIRRRLKDGSAD